MSDELKNNTDDRIVQVATDYHLASPYTKKLIWANISRVWSVKDLQKFEQAKRTINRAQKDLRNGRLKWSP